MGLISEFKEFINRGSAVDLAVGVIIGGAFGKITTSLVDDIFMPLIGVVVGGKVDFSNLYLPLSPAVSDAMQSAEAGLSLVDARKLGPVLAYGNFLTVLINFVLVALAVFVFVKAYNRMRNAAPPAPPEPPASEKLLAEIRDLLKSR
jgi:large conductance mechanosensitive channel